MSKYFKYFILISVILLSGFIISSSKGTEATNTTVKDSIVEEEVKKEIFKLVSYPKEKTKKVTHKLDSLFTRIHKRQDFHGSILIAKNGKLLFSNEYGYANFGKKNQN